MQDAGGVTELAVSLAWHDRAIPSRLRTVDGQPVEAVFRGTWSHGLGPDFADAMVLFDGRELRSGAVEIHLRTGGWAEHGHHLDPRYLPVVLHVVLEHDGSETRRADGALVPVVDLTANGWAPDPRSPARAVDWSQFGGASCAEQLTVADPNRVRRAIWHLGDVRLATRAARVEAEFDRLAPAEVLYRLLLDALGYSANRQPMSLLAERLPLASLEAALAAVPTADAPTLARALLLGVGGFLPLSPTEATLADLGPEAARDIEADWAEFGTPWMREALPPTAWTRARVRPANHPASRLVAAADLIAAAATAGGLLAALLDPLRTGGDPAARIRDQSGHRIGDERAAAMVVNALLPVALALAARTEERQLLDAASGAWERLPARESNERTRRAVRQVAGASPLPGLGGRGMQGLIHLDTTLCGPRRCYECPIALAVVTSSADGAASLSPLLDG